MLKRIFISFCVLCALSSPSHAKVLIPAPPQLSASAWLLLDADTGTVLVEHNADEQLPPASLTKMMTSYIVAGEIHNGKIKEQDEVPISVKAWKMGGSKMFVREGTSVPVSDLLRGVIIQSGNDASVALAEFVAGSEGAFADVMNQQAQLLGMHGTRYLNATGWPAEGHLTTARDLSLLARAVIRDYPEHYDIYAEKYFEYNGINQPNRNRLLWRDKSVDGLKTGHTEEAGYCLVASALRGGMRLISVVMGTSSDEARARESQKLLAYGFRYYQTEQVYSQGDIVAESQKVWFGKDDMVDLVMPEDVFLTIPRGSRKSLVATTHIDDVIEAPVVKGQELGRLTVTYQGESLLDMPLVAAEAIEEAGFFSRLWDRLMRFFMGLFS
jgi:D-alanyl-D-alanine carboxypeptidase (penicillin-binding protein 5/6)